jgi:hypothetical protein
MIGTSPDVLAAMGMDPGSYPVTAFMGALGLWATNLWLCVDELKQVAEKRAKDEKAAAAVPPPAAPAGPVKPPEIPQAAAIPAV